MATVTSLTGMCTSAGVAIDPAEAMSGQVFYALTGGKSGLWQMKYDKGDESALLFEPGHVVSVGGKFFTLLGVGQGSDAATMNTRSSVLRFPADTFVDGVKDGAEIYVENKGGHPLAAAYLNTETVAWASATGTVELGYKQEAARPVTLGTEVVDVDVQNASLDVEVVNATDIAVTLDGEVVDVDVQNTTLDVEVTNASDIAVTLGGESVKVEPKSVSLPVYLTGAPVV